MKSLIISLSCVTLVVVNTLLLWPAATTAATLHVGQGQPYPNISHAASAAQPGDTIFIHPGVYDGDQYMENLRGTKDAWITITGSMNTAPIVEGGNQCWHFVDPQYIRIYGVNFRSATSNLVNIDDGGSYDTPAHHIEIERCSFSNGNPDNNNADLLKLSGVDTFSIINCSFTDNKSPSGSGIDMVGCHEGNIRNCSFRNMSSNSIQAKGGSRTVSIQSCFFLDGGARAINMGGSTGEAFFRPANSNYEASHIDVFSSIFIQSGPLAFVGCVQSRAINNTFFKPRNWALRILQETTREGFLQCADNTFRNNILYVGADVADYAINVGSNTQAETFIFSNNLWYNYDDPAWNGPNWPVTDVNAIVANPRFIDAENMFNFNLAAGSPAISTGLGVDEPLYDYEDSPFLTPRSIGALEYFPASSVQENADVMSKPFCIEPNPSSGSFLLSSSVPDIHTAVIYSLDGREMERLPCGTAPTHYNTNLPSGIYVLAAPSGNSHPQFFVVIR